MIKRLSPTAAGILAALLLLTGCTSDDAEPDATPTETQAAPAPVAAIDATMLLPASEMPPWNDAIVWQEADAADLTAIPPTCTLPTPESLGAVEQFSATYEASAAEDTEVTVSEGELRMSGSNTIMLFPDEATAQAALEAYEAAMPECLNQEGDRGLITDDPAASSWTGALDCTIDGCGDNDMLFEFIGVGAQANTVTLVSFNLIAQDANFCSDPEICPDPRDPVLPEVYTSLERMNTP